MTMSSSEWLSGAEMRTNILFWPDIWSTSRTPSILASFFRSDALVSCARFPSTMASAFMPMRSALTMA